MLLQDKLSDKIVMNNNNLILWKWNNDERKFRYEWQIKFYINISKSISNLFFFNQKTVWLKIDDQIIYKNFFFERYPSDSILFEYHYYIFLIIYLTNFLLTLVFNNRLDVLIGGGGGRDSLIKINKDALREFRI
jgi:hypothetical protein